MYVKIFTTEGVLLDTVKSHYENVKVTEDKGQNLTRVRLGKFYSGGHFATEEVIEVYGSVRLIIKRSAWNK